MAIDIATIVKKNVAIDIAMAFFMMYRFPWFFCAMIAMVGLFVGTYHNKNEVFFSDPGHPSMDPGQPIASGYD